jgi:hypothetical protein
MLSWVVTFRRTLRRSRKSHPLYVLTPSPRAAVPSRRSDVWAFRRADVPKSLPFNLFADPHPLNPAPSIFYKKGGGGGVRSAFRCAVCIPNVTTGRSSVFRTHPLCFHITANSFVLAKNTTSLFSSNSELFSKNTRGGGTPSVQTFNLQTFKRSERPIAAYAPWCHNWQWRTKSSRSGETTPLPPVSKDREWTLGTARSWSPTQVVPRSSALELDRSAGWLASSKRVGKAGSVRLG